MWWDGNMMYTEVNNIALHNKYLMKNEKKINGLMT